MERERLTHAWNMFLCYELNANRQLMLARLFTYLIILISFGTTLAATLATHPEIDDGSGGAPRTGVLYWLSASLPIVSSFLLSIDSRFNPLSKYRQLKAAAVQVLPESGCIAHSKLAPLNLNPGTWSELSACLNACRAGHLRDLLVPLVRW